MTIANSIVLCDNGYGTLASSLAVGDTTITFTTGHGARFPAVAAGQVLYACILDSTNILEEVAITAHTSGSDTATMTRAAGSTTAKAWTSGSRVEARVSSTVLKHLQDEALKKTALTTADAGATYTGSMTTTAIGYVTGLTYALSLTTSNSGATPSINLDGLGAVTVKNNIGGSLAVGQMPTNGLYFYDGTNFILLNPKFPQPTRQVLTSGTGATYTTPTGATRINVRMVGGGGGGAGATANSGSNGTDTTFSTLTAAKGIGGGTNGGAGGAGGDGTNGDVNISGGSGGGGIQSTDGSVVPSGGGGASGPWGGGGGGGGASAAGQNAAANSGGGGGGGAGNATLNSGAGGGAGAYVEKLITAPSATYTYTVGAGGAGGAAGTWAGGNGGTGIIIVDEYYN